jgi:hypothetical protein
MGCGSSSLKRELAEEDEEIDNPQDLALAIESTWALFGTLVENRTDKRFWPTFTRLVRLLRQQAAWTGNADCLDVCISFLELVTEEKVAPGCGTPSYLWSLSTMGQVKLQRFRISNERKDVDDAVKYLLLYAEISQRTDLDATLPVTEALKASYENIDASEVMDHKYILDNIWPKIKGSKVGSHVFRYLGFLWRAQYMQQGDVFSLLACRVATMAFVFAPGIDDEDASAALEDLVELEMAVYFILPNFREFPDVVLPPRVVSNAPKIVAEKSDSALTRGGHTVDQTTFYTPLRNREIRFVELEAGKYDAPIRCAVVVVPVDSDVTFDASGPSLIDQLVSGVLTFL